MHKIDKSVVVGVGKGGVGKTALATTLSGIWAAEHGLRVLLVDADPQANATLAMGVKPADQDHGRSFVDAVSWGDPIKPVTVRERLDLVAAGREISRLAQFLVTEPRALEKFAEAFETASANYDRIVIDLPPAAGASMIPPVALRVGEYLLVPATDHPHDLEGLRVLGDDLAAAESQIVLLGVVLYKISAAAPRARYEAFEKVRRILGGGAEPFATIVRSAPKAYKDALERGQLIHEYLEWAQTKSVDDRKRERISIARNLPDVVAEFRAHSPKKSTTA